MPHLPLRKFKSLPLFPRLLSFVCPRAPIPETVPLETPPLESLPTPSPTTSTCSLIEEMDFVLALINQVLLECQAEHVKFDHHGRRIYSREDFLWWFHYICALSYFFTFFTLTFVILLLAANHSHFTLFSTFIILSNLIPKKHVLSFYLLAFNLKLGLIQPFLLIFTLNFTYNSSTVPKYCFLILSCHILK